MDVLFGHPQQCWSRSATATIDKQLQELKCIFNEQAMKLLIVNSVLDPKDAYKAFNIDKICTLVDKYYPMDFNEQEKINLNFQVQQFIIDARQDSNLKNLSTMQELYLATERYFSAMKIIKNKLRNKTEAEFLASTMIIYIEKGILQLASILIQLLKILSH